MVSPQCNSIHSVAPEFAGADPECVDLAFVGAGFRTTTFIASNPHLLAHKVAVVEAHEAFGPGAYGLLKGLSTSSGHGFFRHVDPTGPFGWIFRAPRTAPVANTSGPVLLEDLGVVLREVGTAVSSRVCRSIMGRPVTSVEVSARSGDLVRLSLGDAPPLLTGICVLASGRKEALAPELGRWADKVLLSEAILGLDQASIQALLRRARSPRIVIAGGSHSAFSMALALLDAAEPMRLGERPKITIVHRSPFRIQYGTLELAQAAPAHWSLQPFSYSNDICPKTGVIFRDSGLRHRSRDLCLRLLFFGVDGVAHRHVRRLADASPLFDEADIIVQALGYRGSFPEIRLTGDGSKPEFTIRSSLHTNASGFVIAPDGVALKNLAAIRIEPTPRDQKDHGAYANDLYANLGRELDALIRSDRAGRPSFATTEDLSENDFHGL